MIEYQAAGHEPPAGNHPGAVAITDTLIAYARDKGPSNARPKELAAMIAFWGGKTLGDIKGATCREYAQRRGAKIAARNELSVLRAAVHHWHKEHTLTAVPVVSLPEPNGSRIRWLRREEAARLLLAAWKARQMVKAGPTRRTGRSQVMTGGKTKRPIARHLARLTLIGIYTGTRPGAILDLYWEPNTMGGWIDVENGVMYRAAEGEIGTKKRKPPVRLAPRLLAHLRRWKRIDGPGLRPVVHWHGKPITKPNKAFRGIVKNAGLGKDVTPHVLRHTRATWLMQAGVDMWEAAGSLDMTVKMLEDVYGHHHPDFQKAADNAY